ncbi:MULTISPECIES: LysR family transcriptional regulator substrate-binding protein [unclassified Corynebacterium]|uniref:LysR family transcriptional regulator substrate-binding protein n=1 Tax=unclassified Corynebacterium TaxID=2624378 RepID=UPI0030AF032D
MSRPDSASAGLSIAFVTGANPEKWFRRFRERSGLSLHGVASDDPGNLLRDDSVDMALVRDDGVVELSEVFGDDFHKVRLYEEAWGVAVEKEHVVSLLDEVADAELAEETLLLSSTDATAHREMMPVVATGAGIATGPLPLLRALAKKAIEVRPVSDATMSTHMWLVWPKESDDDVRQEFVGIVQGRRAGSTRSEQGTEVPTKKLSAREKTLAKQARREAQNKQTGGGRSGGGRAGGRSGGRDVGKNRNRSNGGGRSMRGKRR